MKIPKRVWQRPTQPPQIKASPSTEALKKVVSQPIYIDNDNIANSSTRPRRKRTRTSRFIESNEEERRAPQRTRQRRKRQCKGWTLEEESRAENTPEVHARPFPNEKLQQGEAEDAQGQVHKATEEKCIMDGQQTDQENKKEALRKELFGLEE